jgi:hypothetical protein
MPEPKNIPDKDIRQIEIELKRPHSLAQIEEEIRKKLHAQRVEDLLCTPGDEMVIRMRSEGN